MDEAQAEAVVDTVADAFSDLSDQQAETVATKTDIVELQAEIFRALWIQGAGLVGIQLAIAGLLFAAIRFFS